MEDRIESAAEQILVKMEETGLIKYDGNTKEDPIAWDESRKIIYEMLDIVYRLFNQSCQTKIVDNNPTFNHRCISSYEKAQEFLLDHGIINPKQCEYI